jgi:hypothetical protein
LGQASRPLKIEHKKTLTFIVRVVVPPRFRIAIAEQSWAPRR